MSFFVTVKASALQQGEGFNSARKYTYNKNILINHTKWQWSEVQLKNTMVYERMQKQKQIREIKMSEQLF